MRRLSTVLAIALMGVCVMVACSDEEGHGDEEGVLLPGDEDAPAIDATYDLSVPVDLDPSVVSTVSEDEREVSILRTELTAAFDREATVGEVNGVLQEFDARIVDMIPEHLDFVIRVDDPGNMEAVRALVDEVEARQVVLEAAKSELLVSLEGRDIGQSERELIPDGFEDGSGGLERLDHLDHHLAVRAHAAWNARDAIVSEDERPWLVVTDMFGDGPPGDVFNVEVEEPGDFAQEDDWNLGGPNRHGYHVLGIVSGAFDPVAGESEQARDDVTGIFPESLRLRAVDMERSLTAGRYVNRSGARIKDILEEDPGARIVMSSSIGEQWFGVAWRARGWTRTVRDDPTVEGSGLEDQFVHFTSAGNADEQDDGSYERWDAVDNGPFAYAALGHMETNILGTVYPNLTNIHVVENRRNTSGQPPLPACVSVRSIVDGTLSAIGSSVHSIGECREWNEDNECEDYTGQDDASEASGTSMATPQAAGLAAYMWSVNPGLSVTEIHDIIEDTARWSSSLENRGANCHPDDGEPVIDALSAVLAAGGDDVREAILDVTNSGSFDEADLQAFADQYAADDDGVDYSRFDLTGDGVSGSATEKTQRFDLDDTMSYGTVDQQVVAPSGPSPMTLDYDEESVSDWDVLCYYAYSDLYEGDPEVRDELISARCSGALIEVTVTDTEGTPLEGVPLEMTRNGDFTIYDVEELGQGEYQFWVWASEKNYQIEAADGFTLGGDTTIGGVDRYEIVDDVEVVVLDAPSPTLEVTAPSEGQTYWERGAVEVNATITTPSDTATVMAGVQAQMEATEEIEGHGEHDVVLTIDEICPRGEVSIQVMMDDGFGNELVETRDIEVTEPPLRLGIDGAGPVEIAYQESPLPGVDPHWYVPEQTLEGIVRKGNCDYPDDSHLDLEELSWWKPNPWEGTLVHTGATKVVDDDFFREGGEHVKRYLGLSFEHQGEVEQIQRELVPCYGELHIIHDLGGDTDGLPFGPVVGEANMEYPEGPTPEASYPPCARNYSVRTSIADDYYAALAEFEQIQTYLEAQVILEELYDDLIIELDPDDPFPKDPMHVSEFADASWDDEVYEYVFLELGEAMHATSLEQFHDNVNSVLSQAYQELSGEQFAFVTLMAEEVAFHATMFAPAEEGGENAWKHFGFVEEAEALASDGDVDTLAPARAALAGYAEAALITAEYDNYTEGEVGPSIDAGIYGALSAALDEAEALAAP